MDFLSPTSKGRCRCCHRKRHALRRARPFGVWRVTRQIGGLRFSWVVGGAHDVAGLAEFVVAADADGLVFADFGCSGGGRWRVVEEWETDALGGEQFEGALAVKGLKAPRRRGIIFGHAHRHS